MPSAQRDSDVRQVRTDAQLAALVRSGDTSALASLYDRFAADLVAIAYRLLQSREDAEDVVHDVFVGLPEGLRRYEERGALRGWLRKITARVALGKMRLDSAHTTVGLDESLVARSPHEAESSIALGQAVRALTPALRAVLVLKEIEGFSHAEIAELLDISVGASEVRLHRALHALRVALTKGER